MADLTTLLSKFLTDLYAGIFGIPLGSANTYLVSPSANVIEQRNGTNAQEFRVYDSFTNSSNYSAGLFSNNKEVAGFLFIASKAEGTGTFRSVRIGGNSIQLQTSATNYAGLTTRWTVQDTGHFVAAADNTYDIGASGATRPRNYYAGSYYIHSVGNALTAAGNNRATALQLAAQVNNVTTAAASTGVLLPIGVVGMRITIFNAGANPIQVYGTASETVDGVAGSTGVPLANAKRCDYFFVATNTWISAQLGVVSA